MVQGLGFRDSNLRLIVRVEGLGFRVQDLWFRFDGMGFKVQDLGFRL